MVQKHLQDGYRTARTYVLPSTIALPTSMLAIVHFALWPRVDVSDILGQS
jgi:hypothetical protein